MSTEVCPLPDANNLLAASHIQFDQVTTDLTQLEGEVKGMWGQVWGGRGGGEGYVVTGAGRGGLSM